MIFLSPRCGEIGEFCRGEKEAAIVNMYLVVFFKLKTLFLNIFSIFIILTTLFWIIFSFFGAFFNRLKQIFFGINIHNFFIFFEKKFTCARMYFIVLGIFSKRRHLPKAQKMWKYTFLHWGRGGGCYNLFLFYWHKKIFWKKKAYQLPYSGKLFVKIILTVKKSWK